GYRRKIAHRETAAETDTASADAFPGTGLLDLQRRPLLVAQPLAGLARTVRLDQALLLSAARIQRDILKGRHQARSHARWKTPKALPPGLPQSEGGRPTRGASPPRRHAP